VEALHRPEVEVVTLTAVAHGLMPLYMNACNVLLMTSLHEGSPNVVKEALACNLPIVSTDVGDVRKRIGALEGCVVCSDDEPATIAGALRQALGWHQGIDGRKAVLDLDEQALTLRVIDVYRRAVEKFRH